MPYIHHFFFGAVIAPHWPGDFRGVALVTPMRDAQPGQ